MHCGTGFTITGVYGALVSMQTGVFRQQRRVNINQSAEKAIYKLWCEYAHKAGQHNQVWGEAVDYIGQSHIELGAGGEAIVVQGDIGNRGNCCPLEAFDASFIADHCNHIAVQ